MLLAWSWTEFNSVGHSAHRFGVGHLSLAGDYGISQAGRRFGVYLHAYSGQQEFLIGLDGGMEAWMAY